MALKRKRDEVKGSKSVLRHSFLSLYETGEWSDLTIEAGGKHFMVHKAVLCPASKYFHSACSHDFREAASGHIKLPESEKVVDAIIRHLYETPAAWTQMPKPAPKTPSKPAKVKAGSAPGKAMTLDQLLATGRKITPVEATTPATAAACRATTRRATALDLIELRVAADKYGITSMTVDIEETFDHLLSSMLHHNAYLVEVGLYMISCDESPLVRMRRSVIECTSRQLQEISKDETLFAMIYSSKEYLRQAIQAT